MLQNLIEVLKVQMIILCQCCVEKAGSSHKDWSWWFFVYDDYVLAVCEHIKIQKTFETRRLVISASEF